MSLIEIFSSASGDNGSSTTTITDQIADTVAELVGTALKSILGNLS